VFVFLLHQRFGKITTVLCELTDINSRENYWFGIKFILQLLIKDNETILKFFILLCSIIIKFINIKLIFVTVDKTLTMTIVLLETTTFLPSHKQIRKIDTKFSFYFLPRNYFIQVRI
jgi:hypothetical protein